MSGPNVLILDEPTNDFDVETLAALEDLLDGFGGTLLIVSHDRYFLERVCDDFYALLGDQHLTHLTGGVEEYLSRQSSRQSRGTTPATDVTPESSAPRVSQAEVRARAKELARVERAMAKAEEAERAIHDQMAEASTDHARLADLNRDLQAAQRRTAELEEEWLTLAE